jgi:serpin B
MKLIAILMAAVLWSGVAKGDLAPGDRDKLVAANTGFGFDLLEQIAAEKPAGNIFISPYSVSCALQMTAAGAGGQTRTEMQKALKTGGLEPLALNAAIRDLDRELASRQQVTLNLANGLWYQQGFHLKPSFVEVNQQSFQAGLQAVDFGSPASADLINGWADHETQGKIQKVVSFPFPASTRLILANAIYFKGQWVSPFKKGLTKPRSFHLADGQLKDTPMMAQDGDFRYQETAGFQAVRLPYKGGLEMELYLPAAGSSPRKQLREWAARSQIASGFAMRNGSVVLPKFKLDYQVLLNDPLAKLGMGSAFGSGADFSGMTDAKVFISQVLQKSYVDVNEEGTEAAAVTTVRVTALAMRRPPPDRFTMVLDRPFFFVISDSASGAVLFMGVVDNPVGA